MNQIFGKKTCPSDTIHRVGDTFGTPSKIEQKKVKGKWGNTQEKTITMYYNDTTKTPASTPQVPLHSRAPERSRVPEQQQIPSTSAAAPTSTSNQISPPSYYQAVSHSMTERDRTCPENQGSNTGQMAQAAALGSLVTLAGVYAMKRAMSNMKGSEETGK